MIRPPDSRRGEAPAHASRRGLRWLLQRSTQSLRHEGPVNFMLRVMAFFGYKIGAWQVGWYVRRLDVPIEPVAPRIDVRLVELTSEDAAEYIAFHSNLSRDEFLRRLQHRQTCFGFRDLAGQLASVTWTAVDRVWITFLNRVIELEEGEVYLYESYTAPDFRGARLQPFLSQQILTHFRNANFRQAIVMIAPENRSNIASRRRSGFERIGRVFYANNRFMRRDTFRGTR